MGWIKDRVKVKFYISDKYIKTDARLKEKVVSLIYFFHEKKKRPVNYYPSTIKYDDLYFCY